MDWSVARLVEEIDLLGSRGLPRKELLADGSTDVFLVDNRISNVSYGLEFVNGATGQYRDNLTNNVTTPYTGGTNAGNNE